MCGILGFYSFGNTLPDKQKIEKMFSLLESRGTDASGYAFIQDQNLVVNKAPIRSSELIKTIGWQSLELSPIMIFHSRLKTQGSEKNNLNNHPLFNKQGLCIVHNGMILNDIEIFGKKERDAEVDSEAILAVLSSKKKGDKIKRLFDRLEGGFAIAVINRYKPNELILIKKDNPLELYFSAVDDILYFCSERRIMQDALEIKSVTKRGFNLGEGDYHYYQMENNHSLILNSSGVESYKKYSPRKMNWFSYKSKNTEPGTDLKDNYVHCPWCQSYTPFYGSDKINYCEFCGNELEMEDVF
jgi:glucosamine 6-phosphate synthetase-like amidotransferase/phosphosugar isomerase protein